MTQSFGGQYPQNPPPVAPAAPVQEQRLLAAAAHLSFLTGFWFVAPIVIYALKRRESRFVAFHAMQAAVLHAFFLAGYMLVFVMFLGTMFAAFGAGGGQPVFPFLMFGPMLGMTMGFLVLFGVHAFAAYRAWEGNTWSIPVVGAIARRIVDADSGAARA